MLVFPAAGAAGRGSSDADGAAVGPVVAEVAPPPAYDGRLPFTGLDLALILGGGAALVGAGAGMRRVSGVGA